MAGEAWDLNPEGTNEKGTLSSAKRAHRIETRYPTLPPCRPSLPATIGGAVGIATSDAHETLSKRGHGLHRAHLRPADTQAPALAQRARKLAPDPADALRRSAAVPMGCAG